ncbi:hypothetical protein Lbir_1176 [Legionella birminghamensis]|uniref:Uncharacterized protein n=1 Tax=Legionella birminghamensis TaxID=28083 RepID=A0A378I694_9GAMM|nr:hypothetical protein [Legionella birminghamensis]KTC72401.1 hypothetical protein Lbir_1176 [Legionella birminghamensis]STX30533.1 Uncharacterised protein [Legionella birminghamensis]
MKDLQEVICMSLTPRHEYYLLLSIIEVGLNLAQQHCTPQDVTELQAFKKLVSENLLPKIQHSEEKQSFKHFIDEYKSSLFELFSRLFQISPAMKNFDFLFSDKKLNKSLKNKTALESGELIQDHTNLKLKDYVKKRGEEFKEPISPRGNHSRQHTFYKSPPTSPLPTRRPLPAHEKKTIEDKGFTTLGGYFEALFSIDDEKASKFIVDLVRKKDKHTFAQILQIFNLACKNRKISQVLSEHLSEDEMLAVYSHLLKFEPLETWCRSDNLLPQLFLAKQEQVAFKESTWEQISSLSPFIARINIDIENYTTQQIDFQAEPEDISNLQDQFRHVLQYLLSPDRFPPLMQRFLKLAYADLARKCPTPEEAMRMFLAFILLRFINPVFVEKASPQDSQSQIIQRRILTNALQSISSPSSCTESLTGERHVQRDIFYPVTKDEAFRRSIHHLLSTGLQLENTITEHGCSAQSEPELSEDQGILILGKLVDEFFPLKLKNARIVESRSEDKKPNIQTFFERMGTSPRDDGSPISASASLSLV